MKYADKYRQYISITSMSTQSEFFVRYKNYYNYKNNTVDEPVIG